MTGILPSRAGYSEVSPAVYGRPAWSRAISEYLPQTWRGQAADRWIGRLPVLGVLGTYSVLVVSLHNTASPEEVALIDAGRDKLAHGFAPAAAQLLQPRGVLVLQQVLAAGLDHVGGLELVRALSLLAMLVTILLVRSTVTSTTGARHGVLTVAAFASTATVVYAGALATPVALCLLAFALALRAGVIGHGPTAGLTCGASLAAALALDPGALLLIPAVVLLIALFGRWRGTAFGTWATTTAIVTMASLLPGLYLIKDVSFNKGLGAALTRSSALPGYQLSALGPALGWLVLELGVVGVIAIVGTAVAPSRTCLLPACVVLAAVSSLFLVLWAGAEMAAARVGAYSALALAPIAGRALTGLSRRPLHWVPVATALLLATVLAASQSHIMFRGWVNVRPALAVVERAQLPGVYLSTAADTLRYYTSAEPDPPQWEATSTLYRGGPDAVRIAIAGRRYTMIVLQPSAASSAMQNTLLDALNRSADYEQEDSIPDVSAPAGRWIVYRLLNTVL